MKRDFLFLGCEAGHDWQCLGGCNAGCHMECSCSIPVNICRRCGDCDYGENIEAEQVLADCAARSNGGDDYADRAEWKARR